MSDILARLRGLTADYDGYPALNGIDLELPEGKIIAFCGPNGSGKSTALRVMRGLHRVGSGMAEIAGRPVASWSKKDLAREIAMLGQSPSAPDALTVRELVMLGRFAYRNRFSGPSAADHKACDQALDATEITHLADHPIGNLSGGQSQRAWIAMTLAQDAPRIFLDEPTNHLDISHALELLELIHRLNRENARSFVIVLHDLNLVMRYADHVVLFDRGRVVAQGERSVTLTQERIAQVFGVECRMVTIDGLDNPVIVPLPVARGYGS
ncbi:ABC transporter ATP-binding protein [Paracoccus alkanivorans]|uniref:ABC transporter ATP-binding protein n=1 Tax=Paracoccus alkanivorans TaxID=2116655 RepID=A0A3M0MKH1_9RHOB|nr:ABC transporter ATP-binding protein [Paracoccus alkanivorans]RMC37935.1 ABC transporter ATP-binding protein [Paracoccus alkanivorans]